MTFVAKVLGSIGLTGRFHCARLLYDPELQGFSEEQGAEPIEVVNVRGRMFIPPGRFVIVHAIGTRGRSLDEIKAGKTDGPVYVCDV